MHNDQLHGLLPWFAAHYDRHVTLHWEKENPMPVANKHYVPQLEYYVHAWNKGGHPAGELKDKMRVVRAAVGKSAFDHPTVKPDKVMDKLMRNANGDTILDPFMGTGSTGVAALKAGKKFIGIEKNPKFFNIACVRLTDYYARMSAPVCV
jgi:site-specific DNA-methyltransferase (adenine-specific)